jgi:hypothetical protein
MGNIEPLIRQQYDLPVRMLLEARESWEHVISNTVVHFLDSEKVTLNTFLGVAKRYVEGDIWVELHLTFHLQRESHYVLVIESDQRFRDRVRQFETDNRTMRWNPSVLINVAQFVEPPKQVPFYGRSIPSVIRLKGIDDQLCSCGYSTDLSFESSDLIGALLVNDRELSTLSVGASAVRNQQPNQMVERCSQATEDIARDNRESRRRVFDLNAKLADSILNIDLCREFARFRAVEHTQFYPQAIKMFLRPGCFQIGIS